MKIIDKRKPKDKLKGINAGDVLCYYNFHDVKHYGIIIKIDDIWYFFRFDDNSISFFDYNLDKLLEKLQSVWQYVEKVDAELVIND